ncbi:MAG: guanylate kinase [Defluviicoccus sp.]|nr:guanylate kinase [Defluviicoccus sp.]
MGGNGIRRRGLMLVLSSPSGAGKTTISRLLLESDDNLALSISVTTRPKRPDEVDGRDYRFVDPAAFAKMRQAGELLENAQVFGYDYGTPLAPVESALAEGRDVLFDIDWQGARQLVDAAPNDLVSIFILPPSSAELHARLRRRAQDPDDVVAERMRRAPDEISHWNEFNFVVVNRDIQESVGSVRAILAAERLRRERQIGLPDFVRRLCEDL